jgi:hypothetical protein
MAAHNQSETFPWLVTIRGTPCERSWESPNLSQAMKEVCLEDLIKPNQVATGKVGYNYPQSSANTLE